MKKIEIYNRDTNETFAIIETKKIKNIQSDVIKYLHDNNFHLWLKGKVSPLEVDVYWSAYNKDTKEELNLWYREYDKEKELSNVDKDVDLELGE